jgi:hypothetical protein
MLVSLLTPLVLAALAPAPSGEPMDPPAVQSEEAPPRRLASPWAGWVAGSWASFEVEDGLTGDLTTQQSLVAVDDERVTLREQTRVADATQERTLVISLARMGHPHALESAQQVATESVTVEGRVLECAVWRARFEEDGQTWDVLAWVAPEVEHPLRIKLRGGVGLELELVALEDFVVVSRRKFACVRYEGFVSGEGRPSPVVQWRSSAVPGALVRSVTTLSTPEGPRTHTLRLTAFRGTKLK